MENFTDLREISGEDLSRGLLDLFEQEPSRRGARNSVIRIENAVITGRLDLRAAELPYLLEFAHCRFETSPDLRQTKLAGLALWHCRFPGLSARNLKITNDTVLRNCVSSGVVDVADADLGGSLVLNDSELRTPGQRAIYGDRLSVGGALLGIRLRTSGEIRIPGAKVGGNLTLSGGALRNRGRYALNCTGIRIGGSLRLDVDPLTRRSFTVAGKLLLASAHIFGDLRMRDSVLESGVSSPRRGDSDRDDPTGTLIADRSDIRGDVQIDQGFRSGGTIRMVSAVIGGDLRMAGAKIDLSWAYSPRSAANTPPRAMHLDGTKVLGNLEASGAELHGQFRMTDVEIGGSAQFSGARLTGPRMDVLLAGRLSVGNNLDLRDAEISGSLHLQGAQIGANANLRSAQLIKPAWDRYRLAYKASLDLRAARIGRDLVCAEGDQPFYAEGMVQLRRATIGRQANFGGCVLGDGLSDTAINAFGVIAQEVTLYPDAPPRGRILLSQAQCELLGDNGVLWAATGGVDVDDFAYENFAEPFELADKDRARERLRWLRTGSGGSYEPGAYDQLAKVLRSSGNEEHAVMVLIAKQRHRYQAIAKGTRPALRWPVQLWSLLQRITVSYGYRPLLALAWLALFAVAGSAWFATHPLTPVNQSDHPVWNPVLYTVDQLVPVIDLGHDNMWQARGASEWITVTLIAAGWILATTAAAGISRGLRRETGRGDASRNTTF